MVGLIILIAIGLVLLGSLRRIIGAIVLGIAVVILMRTISRDRWTWLHPLENLERYTHLDRYMHPTQWLRDHIYPSNWFRLYDANLDWDNDFMMQTRENGPQGAIHYSHATLGDLRSTNGIDLRSCTVGGLTVRGDSVLRESTFHGDVRIMSNLCDINWSTFNSLLRIKGRAELDNVTCNGDLIANGKIMTLNCTTNRSIILCGEAELRNSRIGGITVVRDPNNDSTKNSIITLNEGTTINGDIVVHGDATCTLYIYTEQQIKGKIHNNVKVERKT